MKSLVCCLKVNVIKVQILKGMFVHLLSSEFADFRTFYQIWYIRRDITRLNTMQTLVFIKKVQCQGLGKGLSHYIVLVGLVSDERQSSEPLMTYAWYLICI